MKLCIKKIYCDSCQKMVRCREEKVNSNIHVLCSRCGSVLRVWNGITWKYVQEGA